VPGSQEVPCFVQLFFYNPDYATNLQANRYPECNRDVLVQLSLMLDDCNPFILIYKTAWERLAADARLMQMVLSLQIQLVIESRADCRRENLPTGNKLAVIIPDKFDSDSRRDIVLALREPGCNSLQLSRIAVDHAAYIPLHYILLFPGRDPGWYFNLFFCNNQYCRDNNKYLI
jgi:hypothetical protein